MDLRTAFACRVCATLYPTQQEADLCTPEDQWPIRYPGGVVKVTA